MPKGKKASFHLLTGDEQRMLMMGLRRFTKYTNMPNVVELRESDRQETH
jgi:hypothetical protein